VNEPVHLLETTLRDGSYAIGFSILILLAFIGAVAVAFLPKRDRQTQG